MPLWRSAERLCSPFYFETIVIVVFPSLCDTFFYLPTFPCDLRQYSCVLSFPKHSVFRGSYTFTTPSLPWDPLWAANGKSWRCCSRAEWGLGRGDYVAHRRESCLLSHKAVSSAMREFLFQPCPSVPENRTLISTWAMTGCGNKYPPSGGSRSRPDI